MRFFNWLLLFCFLLNNFTFAFAEEACINVKAEFDDCIYTVFTIKAYGVDMKQSYSLKIKQSENNFFYDKPINPKDVGSSSPNSTVTKFQDLIPIGEYEIEINDKKGTSYKYSINTGIHLSKILKGKSSSTIMWKSTDIKHQVIHKKENEKKRQFTFTIKYTPNIDSILIILLDKNGNLMDQYYDSSFSANAEWASKHLPYGEYHYKSSGKTKSAECFQIKDIKIKEN